MLSRRHIRIKVMQSLYSYFSQKNSDLNDIEKSMLKNCEEIVHLGYSIVSLLHEIIKYADIFYEDGKNKHLPTEYDLNPNKRFIQNKLIKNIISNKDLINNASNFNYIWLENDHNVISKIFVKIYKSQLYLNYLNSDDKSIQCDKIFFIDLMNNFVLNNELVNHILEEKSIYWVDDLPFVATMIFGSIKEDSTIKISGPYKHMSDKEFALDLLRKTILNNKNHEKIIKRYAKNWDLERIAIMDQIFLKMSFAEILLIPDLPIKVSMNEYIEISKYYSTLKSKSFVNGLLDSFVKDYQDQGKINKLFNE